MLVSGGEAKYVRCKYRSLRDSLSEAGALRARNRVGDKENRRITDLNHKLSHRLITFAEQFETPVIRMEDLDGIPENSSWSGVHSWHFHQLQQFIMYKAERAGKHTAGHNSVATVDGSRESVLEPRGNAQPEYPLRGFPRLSAREDVNFHYPLPSPRDRVPRWKSECG
ncbi:IS200/IS605 family accessory protein TnpB-related protein [Natrinema halophilum]|nr:IS200/IS605 family accessory protein TnpB-related protein [Natrinema halophilum]UHQ96039.1 IS200/IS605 family accessory protein TnpB-related protein [Natrinema halophilum]